MRGGLPVEEEVSSNLFCPGALMPFYPVMPPGVTSGCAEDAALGLLGQAFRDCQWIAELHEHGCCGPASFRASVASFVAGGGVSFFITLLVHPLH